MIKFRCVPALLFDIPPNCDSLLIEQYVKLLLLLSCIIHWNCFSIKICVIIETYKFPCCSMHKSVTSHAPCRCTYILHRKHNHSSWGC